MKLTSLWFPTLVAASLVGCAAGSNNDDSDPTASQDAQATNWRESIVNSATTADGCFEATYPSTVWESVECTTAPNRPFWTHAAATGITADAITPDTVGNGSDYALEVAGLISSSTGAFPTVKGVTSESDSGTKNGYSIQLNSNFMSGTAACKGVSGCLSWAQFVYSSEEESSFIQNWLIGIGTCPDSSWQDAGSGDCYKNSSAVSTPVEAITKLASLKMTGTAAKSGNDALTFAVGTKAYKASEKDTVTGLSGAWNESEFNIIGDGGGSEAVFNKGSSITVQISVTDGSTTAPTCAGNAGTTGETNNLKLGSCKGASGTSPSITFTETD